MMHLESYRITFATITLIGILLFALPAVGLLIQSPSNEKYSEIYILGPNHQFDDIPFNVKAGVTYSVYLCIGNHMSQSNYYTGIVKIRNETEPLPNNTLGQSSSLAALYKYEAFVQDGETLEESLIFRINDLSFSNGNSQISSITINGFDYPVNKMSMWNSNKTGYFYNLFVELWMFNPDVGFSQFNNQSVHLLLNMTQ